MTPTRSRNTRLQTVLDAIDAANAADPHTEDGPAGEPAPAALLYGQRMSDELDRVVPDAGDLLRIAARGQHIERWIRPRTSYPEGRTGYLAWRRDLARFHADRVAGIMEHAGYGEADRARVGQMLRKEGIKRDRDVQMLEDVICLVFLRWYLGPFAAKHDPDDVFRILSKTAKKMSAECRARVRAEFDLPEGLAQAIEG